MLIVPYGSAQRLWSSDCEVGWCSRSSLRCKCSSTRYWGRGGEGAFSKVISTLEALRSLGIKRLTVGVNFTLNDLNVEEVQEVFGLCWNRGFKFNLIVPHYGHLYQNFGSSIPLGEESKVKALKEVEAMLRQGPGLHMGDEGTICPGDSNR